MNKPKILGLPKMSESLTLRELLSLGENDPDNWPKIREEYLEKYPMLKWPKPAVGLNSIATLLPDQPDDAVIAESKAGSLLRLSKTELGFIALGEVDLPPKSTFNGRYHRFPLKYAKKWIEKNFPCLTLFSKLPPKKGAPIARRKICPSERLIYTLFNLGRKGDSFETANYVVMVGDDEAEGFISGYIKGVPFVIQRKISHGSDDGSGDSTV